MSSPNPNMPMRILLYVVDIIELIFLSNKSLHSSSLIKIPTPKLFLLYNGKKSKTPLPKTMRLSDCFITPDDEPALELTVQVTDISHDSGSKALTKSPTLGGYAYLIHLIETAVKEGVKRDKAIANAMKRCIEEGVLADFLEKNYNEVIDMLGYEYSVEDEIYVRQEDARREGREEGMEKGMEKGREEGMEKGIEKGMEKGITQTATALLERGFPVAEIADILKRPIQWVESLGGVTAQD